MIIIDKIVQNQIPNLTRVLMHPIATHILISEGPSLPLVLDELSAIEIVIQYSWAHIETLDECKSGMIPGVFLYEKDPDTKHLSVKDTRRWLDDIQEIPYEKRAIYILRDFDEATIEAMNTTLKILEEPPRHAIILLVVQHSESLLETIQSRTISLLRVHKRTKESTELERYINEYNQWNIDALIWYIANQKKLEHEEVLDIITWIIPSADKKRLERIEDAIIALFRINETPRNIIDAILLT